MQIVWLLFLTYSVQSKGAAMLKEFFRMVNASPLTLVFIGYCIFVAPEILKAFSASLPLPKALISTVLGMAIVGLGISKFFIRQSLPPQP